MASIQVLVIWLIHQDLSWKYTAVFVHDDVNKKSKQNGDVEEVMHNAHKLMVHNVWSHKTGILCEMWGTHRSDYKEYYTLTHDTVHTARNSDFCRNMLPLHSVYPEDSGSTSNRLQSLKSQETVFSIYILCWISTQSSYEIWTLC
jgi:hypothetical protein